MLAQQQHHVPAVAPCHLCWLMLLLLRSSLCRSSISQESPCTPSAPAVSIPTPSSSKRLMRCANHSLPWRATSCSYGPARVACTLLSDACSRAQDAATMPMLRAHAARSSCRRARAGVAAETHAARPAALRTSSHDLQLGCVRQAGRHSTRASCHVAPRGQVCHNHPGTPVCRLARVVFRST